MECTAIGSAADTATVLLGVGLLRCGSAGAPSSGVDHTPVTSQELPHDPGRSLTASVVALAPGATAASHRHAGIVFASVLEGAVRSPRNGGDVSEYSAGQSGGKRPGQCTPARSIPARRCRRVIWRCLLLRRGRN